MKINRTLKQDLNKPSSKSQSIIRASHLSSTTKKCPGDFCEYSLVKDEKLLEKSDSDYEDFMSKITLALCSDLNSQTNKYKQELGSNCIEKEHEKLRVFSISNSIPFRYILIGRSMLINKEKCSIIQITSKEIQNSIEPEYRQSDKPPNPLAHPTRIYDETKVCNRCYEIYNLIRFLKSKKSFAKNLPRINRDIPHYYKIDLSVQRENLTEFRNKENNSAKNKVYKLTTTDKNPEDISGKIFDDIASKIFPNNYISSWCIKSQSIKNSES